MEKSLGSTFSNARYKYHVKFKEAQNVEEAKANVPSGLSEDRWHRLCDLFNDKKWKDKSNRNTKNRVGMKSNHTCGSKSFISHLEEVKKKNGKNIGAVERYKMFHTKKDGSFVTPLCEENYNLMLEKLADEDVQLTEDQIVTQVLGTRPGYVRGMVKFVISTPFSSRSHYETGRQ
ncbi:Transposase, Ptta/En/Spm, plant [Fagus crenata]